MNALNRIAIHVVVQDDFELRVGGPRKEGTVLIRVFKRGERLTLREVTRAEEHPRMFVIDEYQKIGVFSRGVLAQFIAEFCRSPYTKPGS